MPHGALWCIFASLQICCISAGGAPPWTPPNGRPFVGPPPQTPPARLRIYSCSSHRESTPPQYGELTLGLAPVSGAFMQPLVSHALVPEFQSLKNSRNCPHGTKALGGCRNHPHPRCPHRRVAPLSAVLCGADDAITLPPGSCLSGGGRGAFNQDQLIGLRCSGLVSQSLCSLLLQRKAPMTCH